MTSSPVLAILKLQHEKVRISVKNKLMSKISSYGLKLLCHLAYTTENCDIGMGEASDSFLVFAEL